MSTEAETPAKGQPWATARIYAALRAKYAPPGYAFLAEVPDATGWGRDRTADALAFSCWPSRGLSLIGVEVKASRSDWTKELADPAKAESICRFCDYWYLAVGGRSIVKPGELPPTWGLLVPRGDKLVVDVEAPPLDPTPIGRAFLAAIFRKVADAVEDASGIKAAVEAARAAAYREGKEAAEKMAGHEAIRNKDALESLRRAVAEFEEASGVRIGQYVQGRRIGEAVKLVLAGGLESYARELDMIAVRARAIVDGAEKGKRDAAGIAANEGRMP